MHGAFSHHSMTLSRHQNKLLQTPATLETLGSTSAVCTLPPKQNLHTGPLQLVHPNMHKARSFPCLPAKNTGYFPRTDLMLLVSPAHLNHYDQVRSTLHHLHTRRCTMVLRPRSTATSSCPFRAHEFFCPAQSLLELCAQNGTMQRTLSVFRDNLSFLVHSVG